MYLIKLGGSVITNKHQANFFKQDITDRLAAELSQANHEYIIVHGAGSFGHILAKKYQLNNGSVSQNQHMGFAETQHNVQHLNSLILNTLHKHHLPAVSIPPHATVKLDNHTPFQIDYTIFKSYLQQKFLPVTYGDVVLDKTLGFSICSGDLLIQLLASHFKPEKVLFVIDEDGLYTANPKTNPAAELITAASSADLDTYTTSDNTYADVTKGMKGKIDTIKNIATMGIDTILLNGNKKNRLLDTLTGKTTINTHIIGGKK